MFVMELSQTAVEECNLLLTKIHEVMREQLRELIMFMISDKDQMQTSDSLPLNLLRLAHGTWSKISKMGKLCILEEILSANKVPNGDKDLLMLYQLPVGSTEYHNINTERKHG